MVCLDMSEILNTLVISSLSSSFCSFSSSSSSPTHFSVSPLHYISFFHTTLEFPASQYHSGSRYNNLFGTSSTLILLSRVINAKECLVSFPYLIRKNLVQHFRFRFPTLNWTFHSLMTSFISFASGWICISDYKSLGKPGSTVKISEQYWVRSTYH
jgi:hypothetical protein